MPYRLLPLLQCRTLWGIQAFHDLPADIVKGQIEAIINDVQPDTVKVGMIRTIETLSVVVDALLKYHPHHVIYDPIVTTSNGDRLLTDNVIMQIRSKLLPLCDIVILREGDAERIFTHPSINWERQKTRSLVLDDLVQHGLSNSFSSALAVYLSKDEPMEQAIQHAKEIYSHTRSTQRVTSMDVVVSCIMSS